MDPLSVFSLYDALSSKDLSVLSEITQLLKAFSDEIRAELLSCFISEGIKDFVSMMMSVMVMVVMMLVSFMIVIVVMMLMLIFVIVIMVMMMLVLIFVIMVMVMMVMLMLVFIFVIVIVMVVAAALGIVAFFFVMIVMMLCVLLLQEFYSLLKSILVLHSLEYLLAVKLIPVCGYDSRMIIVSSHEFDHCLQLILCHILRMAEYDR